MKPINVGLVGAGPWAEKAYGPMLTGGPETRLAAVWARRPEAARELAARLGTRAADSFEALLEVSDAVAFAVPPGAQAQLAVVAAGAGKHLLLDKPLAITLEAAERLAGVAQDAGVVSQIMLTHRFRQRTADFLLAARGFGAIGARLAFLSSAFVRGPYANSWRREHGALHDLGPHAFDLLEAALGPIERLSGSGHPCRWVSLVCEHAGGAVSEMALTGVIQLPQTIFRLDLYRDDAALEFDAVAASSEVPWPAARQAFAAAVRSGRSGPLDVRHGLRIQRLIHEAGQALQPRS